MLVMYTRFKQLTGRVVSVTGQKLIETGTVPGAALGVGIIRR